MMFKMIPTLNLVQPINRDSLLLTDQQKAELTPFVHHLRDIAEIARNSGLLGVKNLIADETDPFLKKAMQLMTETRDGQLTYTINQVLELMGARIIRQARDSTSVVRHMLSLEVLHMIYQGSLDMLDEVILAMTE